MRLHEDKTNAQLIERLRELGALWFKNNDLLILEELIWRFQHAQLKPTDSQPSH